MKVVAFNGSPKRKGNTYQVIRAVEVEIVHVRSQVTFFDRAFYVASVNRGMFRHKVGVSAVADRRAGGIAGI